eukprot:SAG25_NODE_616_length_6484_cov_3.460141_2_plen_138_part_00
MGPSVHLHHLFHLIHLSSRGGCGRSMAQTDLRPQLCRLGSADGLVQQGLLGGHGVGDVQQVVALQVAAQRQRAAQRLGDGGDRGATVAGVRLRLPPTEPRSASGARAAQRHTATHHGRTGRMGGDNRIVRDRQWLTD